jgi:hypothetical protein
MPQPDLRQIKSRKCRLPNLRKGADAPPQGGCTMNFIERYPNFSTLLVAIAVDAIAVAILLVVAPPRF